MNDAAWRRLLTQIRDGYVVPVIGPRLLVGGGGQSVQLEVAKRLLRLYDTEVPPSGLSPFRELNEAVSCLKPRTNLQDLYADVHDAIQEVTKLETTLVPPIQQLAQIVDFRLLVTLTPDDLLARSLRQRCAVTEIVHSPNLPTSESRDLPPDWLTRSGEVFLWYMFGKSRPRPMFAIHDEDVLEYAHNVISRGSHVPTALLGELQQRSLLLIGCNFPDWLSRFFIRATNKNRLSEKVKREWLIEQLQPEESLTCFLRSYSKDTELLSQIPPVEFVAELHRRWLADRGAAPPDEAAAAEESLLRGAMFFISYSRSTDRARAETMLQALLKLGVGDGEVWFDRQAIEPGQDFRTRIIDGIQSCRYFVPLLSRATNRRDEAFVFREWREATDRLRGMNRDFVLPMIVDVDYAPERYTAEPVRAWSRLDFGHAPDGVPDGRTTARLTSLVREARLAPA